jgi:toxin ParE1/3/4
MARVELAPEVLDDFDRFFEHMTLFEVQDIPARIDEIVQAIQILTHSPLIGRPVKDGKRELVIGRNSRGYVALYRFVASIDTVFVLAVRSQREVAYKHDL